MYSCVFSSYGIHLFNLVILKDVHILTLKCKKEFSNQSFENFNHKNPILLF